MTALTRLSVLLLLIITISILYRKPLKAFAKELGLVWSSIISFELLITILFSYLIAI